jgi:RNA recognition motif-containing protein
MQGDRDESIDAADHSSVSATQINDEPPKKEKKKKKKKATEIIAREEATEECASTTISKKSTCDDDDDDSDQEDGQEDLKLETEAISHKERRKRRKLEKKKSAQKDDDEDGETKTSEAVTSSRKVESIFTTATRSKHGVWVGNLLFTTTAQELARFFEPAGKVTRLNMPAGKRAHEANTGFAYVDFDSAEAVDAALEKSECLLGGRKLLIKRSSDYSGRPSAIPASITPSSSTTPSASIPPPTVSKSVRKILDRQKQPPAPCIYFGNLGFETTVSRTIFIFFFLNLKFWTHKWISNLSF